MFGFEEKGKKWVKQSPIISMDVNKYVKFYVKDESK